VVAATLERIMTIEPAITDRVIYALIILVCAVMVNSNTTRIRIGEPWERKPSIILGFIWAAVGAGAFMLAMGWL
jgi:hypothetical protein